MYLFMQDEYGEAALIGACAAGHVMVAAVLIEKGALVNYQNRVCPLWLSYMHSGVGCSNNNNNYLIFEQINMQICAWKKHFCFILSDYYHSDH